MNIYEISEEFKVSLAKLRAMEKRGVLIMDGDSKTQAGQIRQLLKRGQPLTASLLLYLVENPDTLLKLGKFTDRAIAERDRIGDAEPAPKNVAAQIRDAARNEPASVEILANWLLGALPSRPVGYQWIAVRLLMALPEAMRAGDVKMLPRALLNVRKRPEFAALVTTIEHAGRNVAQYRALERLDL